MAIEDDVDWRRFVLALIEGGREADGLAHGGVGLDGRLPTEMEVGFEEELAGFNDLHLRIFK